MMKIGFICEGLSDRKFLESEKFNHFLFGIGLDCVNVIDAEGSGNLLPHNISGYIQRLEQLGAEKIVILTDLDADACITMTKQRINARPEDIVLVAVKELESWFLASTTTMRKLLNDDAFYFEFPEKEADSFEQIRQLKFNKTGSGITKGAGGKRKLISILLTLGLDIRQAATHENCYSAKYFVQKLSSISSNSF